MYMLQLFDRDDAVHPVDVRLMDKGSLTIGRDPASDWPIEDPDCALSRTHCEIRANSEGLGITVSGANGVRNAATGTDLPLGGLTELRLPAVLEMGRFRLVATIAPHMAASSSSADSTMISGAPLGHSIDVPSEWNDPVSVIPRHDGTLLEAFCAGAGLDPSLLSSEDPDVIMLRAGALYRQMVLGIGDLMAERDKARMRYQMSRTTIGGEANNPFKWAPTQRLAIDLLLAETNGFLSGPAALKASFKDLKRHLIATFAGLQGSLRAAIERFAPASLEQASAQRTSLLKSRSAAQIEEVAARHADLSDQLANGRPGSLDHAFATAYAKSEGSLRETTAA